ncbi:MAG: hypothetical protein QOI98_33 [Solirubrobacteraceae bacterium]|nr:hypothetical protein [Solirubrobacteraceae bacterium]
MEHRGPDARGIHVGDGVGLAAQRLRVVDLRTGDQPIYNEDRSVVVVLNGEIYNHPELRDRLERNGHRFATRTDTEVIVHLYEEEGPACVRSLHGMFAFAVWDAPRRRLLLARDRVGKKPLVYSQRGGALSFASEINALRQDREVSSEIDPQAIDCYLAYHYVPAPLTAFRAIRKLPPASTLVFEGGEARVERYWSLRFDGPAPADDPHELAERARAELQAAVRRRMVADVPLGALLSGGVDSSAVVAAMARESSRPVKTFTIGFPSARFDERPHARRVAQLFGTDHHEVVVEPRAAETIPTLVRQFGEPFGDSSALPSFHLAALARGQVTVALNGDGGDEAFAGYPRYRLHAALDRAESLPRRLRDLAGAIGARLPSGRNVDGTTARLRRLALGLATDPLSRYVRSVSYELDRDALYRPAFRSALDASATRDVIAGPWARSGARDVVNRMLDVDIDTYLPGDLLVKMDIATMAHSLEARSPFLDHALLEFAAAIPGERKLPALRMKAVLRDALRGELPDDLLDRPKRGFEVPVAEWFRGELRGLLEETLLDPAARVHAYLEPAGVAALVSRHLDGAQDNSAKLWALMILELWLQEVADAAPATVQVRRP